MPHNDTLTINLKLFKYSGQFSTTILTSEDFSGIAPQGDGISWDGVNTPWNTLESPANDKLYLTSGQFSSTLKTSLSLLATNRSPSDISWDGVNTPWAGEVTGFGELPALLLQSGQFSSTIKTSQSLVGISDLPSGISWDETNTPWSERTVGAAQLLLQSGQFTTTIKESEDVTAVDTVPRGITWDGTNTPWVGTEAGKFYLTSGQFTSTIKTSAVGGQRGIETNAINLSCDVSGTIVALATDESDIVAGGRTIILTLNTGRLNPQSDTWEATVGADNPITQALIDGITGSGVDPNGWNAVVRAGLTFSDVARTSEAIVTITLPAFAGFDITIDESITPTIPATALTGGNGPLIAAPTFVVATEVVAGSNDTTWSMIDAGPSASKLFLTSGQFSSTLKDSEDILAVADVRSVGTTGTDTPWIDDADKAYLTSGQFSATLKTSLAMGAVDTDLNGISWDNTNTPVTGNSANKLFLTSGQFTTTIKDSEDVSAVNATPRGLSWDGTNTPWTGQLSLVTFTDRMYLQSGQFTSTIKTSFAVATIDNIVNDVSFAGTTGDTPWIGAQSDKLYLTSGQFSSTLHDSEDISGITNGPNGIDVNDRLGTGGPAALTLTGSILDADEQDVRDGAKTIILVLSGDTWVATAGADNPITQAIIDGLVSDGSEGRGWNAIVVAGLNAGNVGRTSDTIITITLPAFATYDISDDETITATAPASALTGAVELVATPTFTIDFIPIGRPAPRRVMSAEQMKEYVTYVTPNGDRFPLNTPHQFGRWVISYSGLGTPPIDYITQRGPFQDGVTVKDFFLGPRLIQLLIRQEFCDRLDWWDGRASLLDAIRPNRQLSATATVPGVLEWCLPNGQRRQINTFITEGPRFEPRELGTWDEVAFQEALRFVAHDPLFFDPTEVVSAFVLGVDSDLVFPITFPIQFGSGVISDTLNLIYVGTWKTFPTIVIVGPLEDPVITNTTTGEKLEFTIDIPAERTVTIDLAYGVKTVVDDLGNNLIGNLSADSNLATWHLAPDPEATLGLNVITLTGLNPTGATSVQIRYFTRYFGF